MRVLLTGHDGYIGSVMAPVLVDAGHEVTGLDCGLFSECRFGPDRVQVPALAKDLRDVEASDLRGFEAVVHYGGLCNDPLGDLDPALTHEVNAAASIQLARLAREAGVSRYVYASSCSLYGAASSDDVLTEDAAMKPLTPYAESKVRSEEEIAKLADSSFTPVFMRNATAYGASPRLRADIVLNNLMCWAFTTGKIKILSDGSPWRPMVHVEDIATAAAELLAAPREVVHNQAFNIGGVGENYQVRDLAEIVRKTVTGSSVEYGPQAGPDLRNYRVDFAKLARALPKWRARWNPAAGAEELHRGFRRVGLTRGDFEGGKFTRLTRLKALIAGGRIDGKLRWANV